MGQVFAMTRTNPTIQWKDATPLPAAVAGGYAAVVGTRIIYAGGSNWRDGAKHWLDNVHIYDPKSDQWSEGPALPLALGYGVCAGTAQGMEIFGGTDGKAAQYQCWRFDGHRTEWMFAGTVPFPTLLSQATAVGRDIYVFGGSPDLADLTQSSATVMASHSDGRWTPVSVIPHGPVAVSALAVIGNRIYLFGGCFLRTGEVAKHSIPSLINSAEAHCFDTTARRWTRVRPLPRATRGLNALALDEHHILLAGGYSDSNGFSTEVLIYDVRVDEYRSASTLPAPVAVAAMVKYEDRVVLLGGEDRMQSRTDRVLIGQVTYQ
jgi:N-acetylneuraminic acid mutarotase